MEEEAWAVLQKSSDFDSAMRRVMLGKPASDDAHTEWSAASPNVPRRVSPTSPITSPGKAAALRPPGESITNRFHLLAANPYLGPGRRSFPAGRYIIVYRVAGQDVLILRVAHSRRDIEALFRR